ncbi:hypothetical protein PG997_002262 [Apiospora hydei]|uniref:Deoxyribonuclease NucA/NucB domain-containing protein n=1 Tax=Apiospora hydei TaxID=1337664 RepID=A0ABR1X8V3_9PEZI
MRLFVLFLAVGFYWVAWASIFPAVSYPRREAGLEERANKPKPKRDGDADKPFTFVVQCSPYNSGKKKRKGAGECKKKDWKDKNPGKTSCDEFPFASTSEADGGKQFFRCTDDGAQDSQGAQIKNAIKACQKQNEDNKEDKFPCKFSLSFKGEEDFQYCKKNLDCKPDGNLFTKGNKPLNNNDMNTRSPAMQGGYYQLRSGETIYSPSDLAIGTVAVRNVFSNNTIPDEEAKSLAARGLFDGDEWEDEEFVQDEVVAKLWICVCRKTCDFMK